ncbi:hypothetical protein JQM66_05945 [Oscillibacter valericigenes]|uniref:hypothetical protein n=1 Tax=Oscillibacter valericigenes TaxID=351091 RepID=UPI001F24172D|nr:hypothetical protein [Oscillibacter valericigenes]MCF2664102.1 hypothetical protein [Oscillibacter valericigenes]
MNHSLGYNLGMLAGVLVGVLVGVGIIALLFKLKVMDLTFDERQERARGQAYKYGFWTLVACLLLYGFSDMVLGRWCDVITGAMLCIAAALMVFASVCIVKDAYLSLKEKPRAIMTLLTVVSALNLGIGFMNWKHGRVVEDGILTFSAVNGICGLVTLVILVVYVVNCLLAKQEAGE